ATHAKVFGRRAENLPDTPGLGDAAAGGVGRVAVEDLGDAAGARFGEVGLERGQDAPPFGDAGFAAHADERGEVRSEEPRPDRALVIGAVALARATEVRADETRVVRRQRAQSDGREQLS